MSLPARLLPLGPQLGLLVAIGAAATLSVPARAAAVARDAGADLAAAEDALATRPDDATLLARLVALDVAAGRPGHALAALSRASAGVRHEPEVEHVAARAYLGAGRVRDALVAERAVLASCERAGCRPALAAEASHRFTLLSALAEAGIDDPEARPEEAARAVSRAVHRVRLASL